MMSARQEEKNQLAEAEKVASARRKAGGAAGLLDFSPAAVASKYLDTAIELSEGDAARKEKLAAAVTGTPLPPSLQLRRCARKVRHGRREEVAAALFVHPQTVRYRMGQLRELYGDRLEDPETVLALTVALA